MMRRGRIRRCADAGTIKKARRIGRAFSFVGCPRLHAFDDDGRGHAASGAHGDEAILAT